MTSGAKTEKKKPKAESAGKNGNVFNLMWVCYWALKDAGMPDAANEMRDKIMRTAKSYDEALRIMTEYCDAE